VSDPRHPLLTQPVHEALLAARKAEQSTLRCSLDLDLSQTEVGIEAAHWHWQGARYPYPERCKPRTVYHWRGGEFAAVARFGDGLIKLVPTDWGPPTFEIDGIKMLPTAHVCPFEDARQKVALIRPHGKVVLDTCGGLGYFAAWCLRSGAQQVQSFEKNLDVIWLRGLNPWSPAADDPGLTLTHGDITEAITTLPDATFDAVLHDPPRFGIAGELYSLAFYTQLARVLRRGGRMFHYTGAPNRLTSRRDVPSEVVGRLQQAGFDAAPHGDGVLATRC
jgi:uncharacterized protein